MISAYVTQGNVHISEISSCLRRLENMVVNLCLPHFQTTAHCNKLCADGYDVTNLLSADPALRRRGFKLEYFLRPPVQVTLTFGFQVELCRVDVALWPWGMDRGQACKKLEISTSCDPAPSTGHDPARQKDQMQVKNRNEQNRETPRKRDGEPRQSNGHQWSRQARRWGGEAPGQPQQRGHAFKCQPNTEPGNPEPEFKLVARCELSEDTQVCFTRSNLRPRAPFPSPPPPQPANCRQEELWSRGAFSLGAVTQLRVTVPYGGAASCLGLKTLVVWGQPSRCCTAEEVERIKEVHKANERQLPRPAFFTPAVRQTTQPEPTPSSFSIPEEFLDPITQEVMMLPMLLPSGVSVDHATLDEYRKREATWGRAPNDPFTGVPFTSGSQPLPNPQLKSRIDQLLLQKGMPRRDGVLGRQDRGENPRASRLIDSKQHGQSQNSPCLTRCSMSSAAIQHNTNRTVQMEDTGLGPSSYHGNHTFNTKPLSTDSKSDLDGRKKRERSEISTESPEALTAEEQPSPRTKRPRNEAVSVSSCSSHEQRLSASLDEALFSALQGRPSFTSNLSQQRRGTPDSEPQNTTQQCQALGFPSVSAGEETCSACSRSVSVYFASAASIYRLPCGHLLCRGCLQREAKPLDSATTSTSDRILCPTCQSSTPRSHVTRVHH